MGALSREQAAGRERTLLAAVLLSVWGPLATGLAVCLSSSTTQLADFIRRTVELLALFLSWQVFRHVERRAALDPGDRARLETVAGIGVAVALCCSGVVMLVVALYRSTAFEPGGNVYPGLAIAGLGLIVNVWFWRRYSLFTREQYNAVIDAQRPLYGAKALVDLCVIAALAAVALYPDHPITRRIDILGSIAVALYLLWNGTRTARRAMTRLRAESGG